jgi:hypothetical protein
MTLLPQEAATETDSEIPPDVAGEYEGPQLWTSDAALTFDEARTLMSKRGATVVMLAGEVGSGKTTLLVELWTDLLLAGALGEVRFAGSTTALAFEERSFESRLESGGLSSETRRTNEDDDGFLHLAVTRKDGRRLDLLFADVTGEHFRSVREGRPIDDEFDWLNRVDRFLVLVDGALIANNASAESAFNRTRRLLFALRQSDLISSNSRIAIVVTKDDQLTEDVRKNLADREQSLHSLAQTIESGAAFFRVAARPTIGETEGLHDLMEWICPAAPGPSRVDAQIALARPLRAFGRFRS